MSKRLPRGRGGQLVTLVITGFPATATLRDVRAALMDRSAGRVSAIVVEPERDWQRTARVRLAWRSAQRVLAAPAVDGGWPLAFRLGDPAVGDPAEAGERL